MSVRFLAINVLILGMFAASGILQAPHAEATHICDSLPPSQQESCRLAPGNQHGADPGNQVPYSVPSSGGQPPITGGLNSPTGGQNPTTGGQNPSSQTGSYTIVNPLKATNFKDFLLQILDILLIFALPIVIFFIILAGFNFVIARGNVEKIGDARRALLSAVIGGVIIFGARIIIDVIQGTVKALGN